MQRTARTLNLYTPAVFYLNIRNEYFFFELVAMTDKSKLFDEPFTLISTAGSSIDTPESSGFLGKIQVGRDWIQSRHAVVRPWSEFLNIKKVSKPKSGADVLHRIVSNVQRFQSNYLFVFLGLVIYCIVTNPTLLFALGFCLASWWFISVRNKGEGIKILGRETAARELYAIVVVIAIVLFYFAGAGGTVFWIIGASVVLILTHAVVMAPLNGGDQTGIELGDVTLEEVTVT